MPYIGVHVPTGDFGDGYDAGLRLGTLLGGHLSPTLSLNGELTIDVLNPEGVPSGADVTAVMVDLLFSPLFHFRSDAFEGFIGPKLGAFGFSMSASYLGDSFEGTARGFAYGMNAGFGIPVGNMAIGGLFSYVGRHATQACTKLLGEPEECDDSPGGDDAHTIAFAGLVLF
jgi:hypothetical protein